MTFNPSAVRRVLLLLSALSFAGCSGVGVVASNTVIGTWSQTGALQTAVGSTQAVTLAFATNNGKASNLQVMPAVLPAGWTATNGMVSCSQVTASGGCLLALRYAPLARSSGTLAIAFQYVDDTGSSSTGSAALQYSSQDSGVSTGTPPALGGTITGLTNAGLVLANNGAMLAVSAGASSFTFGAGTSPGSLYAVTVSAQPGGLTCSIANGSGTMPLGSITSVAVTCSANPTYILAGTISGLTARGLVLADGGAMLPVSSGAISFTFGTALNAGDSYSVTVATQPSGLSCSIINGSGTMPAANVTNVAVTCVPNTYMLGGTISGLTARGLVLANGGAMLPVGSGAVSFTFGAAMSGGSAYSVTVSTQPSGLSCSVANGAGTMPAANVTNVAVTCVVNTYTLGGTLSGLTSAGLVLANNGVTLAVNSGASSFTFGTAMSGGSAYSVTVSTQPSGLSCSVANGVGTMPAVDVTNVVVTCLANRAAIGIQFVGAGTAMGSAEVAGVVAQSNWNPESGTSSATPLVLLDQTGAASGATVTWNSDGTYEEPIGNVPGNNRLMLGYLDAVSGVTTVTVAGLPTNAAGYNVYVYAEGGNGSATRTGAYQISGSEITTTSVNLTNAANTSFNGTFTPADNSTGNYVVFSITSGATGFTITATPGATTDAYSRAPLNAIQIVPANPPAAIGIQFVGEGTAMGSTEVAGVVAQANWNPASGTSSAALLVNQLGANSGATVIWNTNGIYAEPISNTPGDNRLMLGYLDTVGAVTTVTVAGLPTNAGGYDVYVYAEGANGSGTRTGAYQISGSGITTTSVNLIDAAGTSFNGTFTQADNSAGNYVVFPISSAATGFTITATPGATSDIARAPLNAIQIVPQGTPTPDFIVTENSSTQAVVAGNTTSYAISVAAVDGFNGAVTLNVGGLPTGAVGTFSPASLAGGAGSSTLTVTTTAGTPVGSSSLVITGTSGALTQSSSVTLSVTNVTASAASIGVQFVGGGTAMGSTEVAGVVTQSNWNPASGTSSAAPLVLMDQTGASSGATATWDTNGMWEEPISDTPGNDRLMLGYLDTVGGVTTVTVAGLPTNAGGYKVYVYAEGANGSGTRTGDYQISGSGITTTSVDLIDAAGTSFNGTFTQADNSAGNYLVFSITSAATGFTITASPGATTDIPRAPLNAIQIVAQ